MNRYDDLSDDKKLGKDNRIIDDDSSDGGGGVNKKEILTIENQKTIDNVLIEIKKLNEKITNVSSEIVIAKQQLSTELKTAILESEKRIIEETSAEIVAAIGKGRITAELDKRSKTFITAGGIASFVFCLFVIVMGIFGNKYIQDALRYQNLMEVFNVMPTEQYNQIQGWVQTSYQEINPGKTNTPIPTK